MISSKRVVVLQSNYIPWKGYFDLLSAADEFLIFDEVQFTRRDWRNRNKIVVAGKLHWLTIPVQSKGKYDASIDEMEVVGPEWSRQHWQTIKSNYASAKYFREIAPALENAFAVAEQFKLLSEINVHFLKALGDLLEISTPIMQTRSIPRTTDDPTARLIEICVARGATEYISGPAARSYIDASQFEKAGVQLKYANYSSYPEYEQGLLQFEHGVSIIDSLLRCGREFRCQLKSVNNDPSFLEADGR